MRLEIKAFKGLKDKTIELPQTGLVRIAGNSEAGKSTILQAINWALYGDEAIRAVAPLGETKASVILTGFSGLASIARFKGPGRLIVNDHLENDVGQAEIQRVLGMSHEQFSASSYVKQKLRGSLLTLGAADQVRFIQTLAFGAHDPEKYKKVIQDKLTSYTQNLTIKTSLRAQAQENVTRSKAHLETLDHPPVPPADTDQWSSDTFEYARQQIREVDSAIQAQTALLNHPSRTLAPLIHNLQVEIAALENTLPTRSALDARKFSLSTEIQQAAAVLADASDQINRQELKKQARDKLQIALQSGLSTTLEQAREGIVSADANLAAIRQRIATLAAEKAQTLHAMTSIYECPACQAPLTLASNTLHHSHDGTAKSALVATLNTLELEEKQAASFVLDWERYRAASVVQRQMFEESTGLLAKAHPVSDTDFTELVQLTTKKQQDVHAEMTVVVQEINNLHFLEQNLASKRNQLRTLSAQWVQDLPDETLIRESLHALNIRSADHRSFLKDLEQKQAEGLARKATRERAITLDQAFSAALKAHLLLEESLNKVVEGENSLLKSVTTATKLKKLSDESTMSSVSAIVNAINTNLKHYIDLFFPDAGTHIFITNESFTKKDERRAKMGLKIIHKGLEMAIEDFSGGAENRCLLAAQLAISDMFASPILCLDEALTGSHTELRDDILDHLRVVGQSKLILLVEHGVNDSSFDDVIFC